MTLKSNKLLKHTHTKNVSAKHFIDTEKGQSIWFHLHGIQKKEHYRTEVGCVVFRSWVLEREEMDFKGCGGVNNGPQIHPLPDPHNYEWYLVELKWLCKCHSGKDLELRRWPRIIGGGGGLQIITRVLLRGCRVVQVRRKGQYNEGCRSWRDAAMSQGANRCQRSLEAWWSKEAILSWRSNHSADTTILASEDSFLTS